MIPTEFEPTIPESERLHTHTLDGAANIVRNAFNENLLIITGKTFKHFLKIISLIVPQICLERPLPHPLRFILGKIKKCFCSPEQ
jgi:hypothetical protein